MTPVRLEPAALRSRVKHSTTEPLRSLSTFVIHLLESIVSKVNTSKISIFYLVSVAEQVVLSMTWLETPKTGFVALKPWHDKSNSKTSHTKADPARL